jgi:hypothetical protein
MNSILVGMDGRHNTSQEIRIHSITWLKSSGKSIIALAQPNNARNIMDIVEVPGKVKCWDWNHNNKDGLCITLVNGQHYYIK